MSVLNGRLPESALAPVPFQPARLLRADAAAALARLNSLHRAAFGFDLYLNDAYRDYATQVDYKERTRLPSWHPRYLRFASTPGTSVHGWGLAVDIGGLGGFGSPRHKWLTKTAPALGWYQPAQYQQDGRYPESWHWEFDTARVVDRPVTDTPEVAVPDVGSLPDPLTATQEVPMFFRIRCGQSIILCRFGTKDEATFRTLTPAQNEALDRAGVPLRQIDGRDYSEFERDLMRQAIVDVASFPRV